jgi:hypothetical protein
MTCCRAAELYGVKVCVGPVLQKSTATNPMPADNENRQPRRLRAQRQQASTQPRVCKQEVLGWIPPLPLPCSTELASMGSSARLRRLGALRAERAVRARAVLISAGGTLTSRPHQITEDPRLRSSRPLERPRCT